MSKRILAFICMLALLVGLLPVGVVQAEESTSDTYLVGYSIKDINPNDEAILKIALVGNGSDRACTGKKDDGLFTTCTAITDANNTTVLFITLDALQSDATVNADIRRAIMERLGQNAIDGNKIIISASHTHSAPGFLKLRNNSDSDVKAYYKDTILKNIVDAAEEAFEDRAPATMKRGSVDASDESGYQMNFLRHYEVTTKKNSTVKSYVEGSGFTNGDNGLAGYTVTGRQHVAEADDTMYLLQFEFEDKDPVVFVNWRAHPTEDSGEFPTLLSSDYVGALRSELAQKNYRAAFFQGAGGNTIISSKLEGVTQWVNEKRDDEENTNTYGRLLAEIAVQGLEDNDVMKQQTCGDIRTIQRTFTGDVQEDSAGLRAAAAQATTSYPFIYDQDGKRYIINSSQHRDAILKRASADKYYTTQEIAVVSLGKSAAFVTAPNELSDRYGISSYADTNNDWDKLIDDNNYGTPFVITHANDNMGYLPNSLNYDYNAEIQELKRYGSWGAYIAQIGIGSYEANTCHYDKGTGEKLIAAFDGMLDEIIEPINEWRCEACDRDVAWQPVSFWQVKDVYLGGGHYYLSEDITRDRNIQKTVGYADETAKHVTLCLDLNGKKIETTGRTFAIGATGTLNIQDRGENGSIISYDAANNAAGGTFSVNGELNLRGGTLKYVKENDSAVCYAGGVARVLGNGIMRVFGGTIQGGELVSKTNDTTGVVTPGHGGAILVAGSGQLIVSGGSIRSGEETENVIGPCVYLQGENAKVTLEGNAHIEDICMDNTNYQKALTVSGKFTGDVGLSYVSGISLNKGTKIGSVENNADILGATFRLPDAFKDWKVYIEGNNLKIKGYNASTVAVIGESEYDSIMDALPYADKDSIIKLVRDEEAATKVSKDAYLDLNGHDVTGTVTVETGYTLYCMDSQTADYTVEDEAGYGKIYSISGSVEGIPVESALAGDGYLMVNEGTDETDPVYSFHSVNLELTHATLRAVHKDVCAPGIYYKSNFKGDEIVAAAVTRFGVALSVQAMPDATNLDSKCEYSKFETFASGSEGNTGNGTLLYGIMKPDNKALINSRNANMAIYGRAYILTEDGYTFGVGCSRNLKQITEGSDELWNKLSDEQKNSIFQMYSTYSSVMKSWELPNLRNAQQSE